MRSFIILVCFLFNHIVALAGGWTSSGGDIIPNTANPWFFQINPQSKYYKGLQGSNHIFYCIDAAKDFSSYEEFTHDDLNSLIMRAFAYWRSELSQQKDILLAQENMTRVACSSEVDIQFLFGTALTLQQKSFLQDPRRYIGVAVRTDYDLKMLRGRGFIYFSPDRGPNSMYPNPYLHLWTKESLYGTILHELGHVYGISHIESEVKRGNIIDYRQELINYSFMASIFPRALLSNTSPGLDHPFWKANVMEFNPTLHKLDVAHYTVRQKREAGLLTSFFEFPDFQDSVRVRLRTINKNQFNIEVMFDELMIDEEKWMPWGRLSVQPREKAIDEQTLLENTINFSLMRPKNIKLDRVDDAFTTHIPSSKVNSFLINGNFTFQSGKKKNVLIKFSPAKISIFVQRADGIQLLL